MGVHKLWKILEPSGKRITLNDLQGKRLAIDTSIWLNQFVKAIRNADGTLVKNAHIKGLLSRICKLLYHNIRPVFVFDGPTPQIKKKTTASRKLTRDNAKTALKNTTKKLLLQEALKQHLQKLSQNNSQNSENSQGSTQPTQPDDDVFGEFADDGMFDGSFSEKITKDEAPELQQLKNDNFLDLSGIPTDVQVDVEFLMGLPEEIQNEIISQLKEGKQPTSTKRRRSLGLPKERSTLSEFSAHQVSQVLSSGQFAISMKKSQKKMENQMQRISSDKNRRFVLVKNSSNMNSGKKSDLQKTSSDVASLSSASSFTSSPSIFTSSSSSSLSSSSFSSSSSVSSSSFSSSSSSFSSSSSSSFSSSSSSSFFSLSPSSCPIEVKDDEHDSSIPKYKSQGKDEGEGKEGEGQGEKREGEGEGDGGSQGKDEREGEKREGQGEKREGDGEGKGKGKSGGEGEGEGKGGGKGNGEVHVGAGEIVKDVVIVGGGGRGEEEVEEEIILQKNTKRKKTQPQMEIPIVLLDEPPLKKFKPTENVETSRLPTEVEESDKDSLNNHVSQTLATTKIDVDLQIIGTKENSVKLFPKKEILLDMPESPRNLDEKTCEKDEILVDCENDGLLENKNNYQSENRNLGVDVEKNLNDVDHNSVVILDENGAQNVDNESQQENGDEFEEIDGLIAQLSDNAMGHFFGESQNLFQESQNSEMVELDENSLEDNVADEMDEDIGLDEEELEKDDDDDVVMISEQKNSRENEVIELNEKEDKTEVIDDDVVHLENPPVTPSTNPSNSTSASVSASSSSSSSSTITIDEPSLTQIFLAPNLDDLQKEIVNSKILQAKHAKDSDTVTDQMIIDCKKLLEIFGIPYITGPAEADAQCASLEALGLVDGVISDDSDLFLFGAENVFRHVFSSKNDPMYFASRDILKRIGLNRDDMIFLAFLMGSDYCDGIQGVGPVMALELLLEFKDNDESAFLALKKLKEWVNPSINPDVPQLTSVKHVKNSLRKRLHIPAKFPESEAHTAYVCPEVDESTDPFSWAFPNEEKISHFLRNMGWTQQKIASQVGPAIKKAKESVANQTSNTLKKKGTLDGFFQNNEPCEFSSDKMKKTVQGLIAKKNVKS